MAPTTRNNWKDYVWLVWFSIQILTILLVDAVQFYPDWLYKPPGSPLHFLEQLHTHYIATYNDPLAQWTPATATGHDAWIRLFLLIEVFFSLPVVVYAVHRLGVRRAGTTGPVELLFLVYAFETAFTTLVCIHDVFWWDPKVWDAAQKRTFVVNLFGPWFVIPSILFGDMCLRILNRFNADENIAVQRKKQ